MNWIKKNPHLLTLCLLALVLIAGSVMVVLNAQTFDQKFSVVVTPVTPSDRTTALDVNKIKAAKEKAVNPQVWIREGSLRPRTVRD